MAKDANVQKIQQALNERWTSHKYYPLTVDGSIGPKTCWACFDYMKNAVGQTSKRLTPEFFASFGWDGKSWYDNYGRICEPYYSQYSWAGGGVTTSGDDNIKKLQAALNYAWKGHKYYPLTVDGKFGSNTCYAAFDYQTRGLGISGSNLTPQFFASFGFDGNAWATQYGSGCAGYYSQYDGGTSGGETPVIGEGDDPSGGGTPEKKEPLPAVTTTEKPFPWLSMLVGAGGGALIGLAGKKTVLKKQKKIKPAYAALGGAVLGAIGGLIVGKMRQ